MCSPWPRSPPTSYTMRLEAADDLDMRGCPGKSRRRIYGSKLAFGLFLVLCNSPRTGITFVKTTQFEILLEAVPDALVGMDQEGVIRSVNPETKSLFGYNRDHLIGRPMETLTLDHGGA